MKLTFVPIAVVLSTVITSHVVPGQCKILSASMLSGMFFGTNTPEKAAPASVTATVEAAVGLDAPAGGDEMSAAATSGSADLTPKADVVRELAEATQQADQAVPGQDVAASQTDARAAQAEEATEKIVAAATESGAQPTATSEATDNAKAPASSEQQLTEEDAAKNSELLQSVSESAETSWISKVSKDSAIEALLPLVALTPVLAAAGFHADIDESSPGAPLVRFPSIDYAVHVEDLKNYN
ncbi:hypothetical protein, conserved [Eimeria tenella]|uniref:SAG family member n=1 Tax=Eimeria tenella TaxID=5802 RepID=U6KM71_EIMTE|nr:hypothetical protein, conserved [Eimeria tenella]CDJ39096.1 hypothetical protein, conserved [Eimeria tenella]|eukprot:XP_013229851.1 hypothetical protein, conserved [Eimeria tenella]